MSRPRITVRKALLKNVPKDSRLLLAVSGGVDSMCLLSACNNLAAELKLHLEVAHLDHGIRETSSKDASFVSQQANVLGLRLHLKEIRPPQENVNIESWGRAERYSFFKEVLLSSNLGLILTAHNANDVAETLLMRLVSNKYPKSILAHDRSRNLIRPLLSVTRKEIELYARENNIDFLEDESNQNNYFLRNRVRNKLIPLMTSEFDPRVVESLANQSTNIAEDIDALYSLASMLIIEINDLKWGSKEWLKKLRKIISAAPRAVKWRVMELLLKPTLGFSLGKNKSLELLELVESDRVGIELPTGLELRKHEGGLIVTTPLKNKTQV